MGESKFLHDIVYDSIKEKIATGEYPTGFKLPREIDLMIIYDVSRATIRRAMTRLKYDGFVRQIKGTGTFVNHYKADYELSNMASFSEIIKTQDGEPNSIVLKSKLIQAPDHVQKELNLLSPEVYYVERIRKNDEIVLCFEVTYISPVLCPGIDKLISPNTSLYDLYENHYQLNLSKGDYRLQAMNSPDYIARLLDLPKRTSMLFMQATIDTDKNIPLYYVEAYYVGDRYVFSTTLNR